LRLKGTFLFKGKLNIHVISMLSFSTKASSFNDHGYIHGLI